MTDALVQLQAIGKRYDRGGWALRDIDLTIRAGEVLGLVGANGSGKSTLLNILGGHSRATAGDVLLFGKPAGDWSPRALRRRIALVAQDPALDPEMTARETLQFFGALYGDVDAALMPRMVADFGLDDILDIPLARVSGGQRQRVHLVLGMLQQPDLLLFDEPTNALDAMTREQFWMSVATQPDTERSMVVATHHLDEAAQHCHRLAVLSAGALLGVDTAENFQRQTGRDTFGEAFFALTGERIAPTSEGNRRPGRGMGGGRGRPW